MKQETSSIDLKYIIDEMQFLVNSRIDKIYQDKKSMVIQVHTPSYGKNIINVAAPSFFYLASKKPDFPQKPGGFCMFLRKYLDGTRLRRISQFKFERIVELEFEGKDVKYTMIIELFSIGNIILCKDDYSIMSAIENKHWGERNIRGGLKYEFPKRENDILELDEVEFEKAILKSDKDSIVKTLAIDFSLGGVYAEEICSLANVKNKNDKPDKFEIKKIFKEIKALTKKEIKPIVIDGKEAYPFTLSSIKKETKPFETFNSAIDSIITPTLISKNEKEIISKHDKKIGKVKEIIRIQEKQVRDLEKSYEEYTKKGELIYHNYSEIKDILESIKKAKQKYSYKEMKEKLKGHKVVKDIDEKEQKVILEFDEND